MFNRNNKLEQDIEKFISKCDHRFDVLDDRLDHVSSDFSAAINELKSCILSDENSLRNRVITLEASHERQEKRQNTTQQLIAALFVTLVSILVPYGMSVFTSDQVTSEAKE